MKNSVDHIRNMLTSDTPVVRQRGLMLLAQMARSRQRVAEVEGLLRLASGPTAKVGSDGKEQSQ